MSRRGLTLIELILSLGLVSVVALVAVTWLQAASSTAAAVRPPIRWAAAADAVLQLIADDLLCGDFDGKNDVQRVLVEDGRLLIQTRMTGAAGEPGPVRHVYRHDPAAGELELSERRRRGGDRRRLLLDRVREWQCELDEDARRLAVRVVSAGGRIVEREYAIP